MPRIKTELVPEDLRRKTSLSPSPGPQPSSLPPPRRNHGLHFFRIHPEVFQP